MNKKREKGERVGGGEVSMQQFQQKVKNDGVSFCSV